MTTDQLVIIVVAVIVVLAIVGGAVWYAARRRHSDALRQRFGDEYAAAVARHGSVADGERDLEERIARVRGARLRPIGREASAAHLARYEELQPAFVDDPAGTLGRVSALVEQVLTEAGLPTGSPARRADDLSVLSPTAAGSYRSACAVAVAGDPTETEERRRAMLAYREVLVEVLALGQRQAVTEPTDQPRRPSPATEVRR